MSDQIILFLASCGMIALGLYFMFGKYSRKESDRIRVEATIVDHITDREDMDFERPERKLANMTYPVYEYTVDGEIYRTRGTMSITVFSKDRLAIGMKEMLYVDPQRPGRISTDSEINVMAVFGFIIVCTGVLSLFVGA